MRRLGAGVLAAALLGGVVCGARAQEPAGDGKGSWWSGLFGGDKPKGVRVEDHTSGPRPAGPSPTERAARDQKRELNAYLRRMQVCDRLRQIAYDTNDAELERQADELEEQARLVYERATSRLPLAGSPDETALGQRLGTGSATPGDPPGKGRGRDDGGRAALKGEGKP
jgi:hypothetical protein